MNNTGNIVPQHDLCDPTRRLQRGDELELAGLAFDMLTLEGLPPVFSDGHLRIWDQSTHQYRRISKEDVTRLAIFPLAGVGLVVGNRRRVVSMSANRARNIYSLLCTLAAPSGAASPRQLAAGLSGTSHDALQRLISDWLDLCTEPLSSTSPISQWTPVGVIRREFLRLLEAMRLPLPVLPPQRFGRLLSSAGVRSRKHTGGTRVAPLVITAPVPFDEVSPCASST